MPKDPKELEQEASAENESVSEEASEYQHIDEFVKTLDKEELAYLKGCLAKKHDGASAEDSENASEVGDKSYSDSDFE